VTEREAACIARARLAPSPVIEASRTTTFSGDRGHLTSRVDALQRTLWAFQQPKRFPDLTITIGQCACECHRVVLGSVPGYFQALLTQNFRESTAAGHEISIRARDPRGAFPHVLEYLHTGDLSGVTPASALPVFLLAAYFQLAELQLHAERLSRACRPRRRSLRSRRCAITPRR
jgi:hypothetical protein